MRILTIFLTLVPVLVTAQQTPAVDPNDPKVIASKECVLSSSFSIFSEHKDFATLPEEEKGKLISGAYADCMEARGFELEQE